eukprot:TRINITY_DN1468_c0_g1_i2.p1 TRINITY_DN1468_c0_g1~~TRINITY_DN1468_c0_g1_i2.p1  ORF type:complete len:553 (-),score=121.50 TRINITY_DN1468_c0_g1_i2:67-1725(-)
MPKENYQNSIANFNQSEQNFLNNSNGTEFMNNTFQNGMDYRNDTTSMYNMDIDSSDYDYFLDAIRNNSDLPPMLEDDVEYDYHQDLQQNPIKYKDYYSKHTVPDHEVNDLLQGKDASNNLNEYNKNSDTIVSEYYSFNYPMNYTGGLEHESQIIRMNHRNNALMIDHENIQNMQPDTTHMNENMHVQNGAMIAYENQNNVIHNENISPGHMINENMLTIPPEPMIMEGNSQIMVQNQFYHNSFQHMPVNEPVNTNYGSYYEPYMTKEQRERLRTQISEHFQLLFQVLILAKKTDVQYVDRIAQMLKELNYRYNISVSNILFFAGKGFPPEPSFTVQNVYNQPTIFEDEYVKSKCVFLVPGLEDVKKILEQYEENTDEDKLDHILEYYEPIFNRHIYLNQSRTPRTSSRVIFIETEDRIIVNGLKRFGRDWEKIKPMLPSKTRKQVMTRFKNRTAKAAKSNYIKVFWTQQKKELDPQEQEILIKGVEKYGRGSWERISRNFLPNWIPSMLEQYWKELVKKRALAAEEAAKLKKEASDENVAISEPQYNYGPGT